MSYEDYMKRAAKSDGFDVNSVGKYLCGGIVEFSLTEKSVSEKVIGIAKDAIKQHNDEHKSNLVFDSLVKCNGQVVGGYMYYITFTVRSPTNDQPMLYEAKVWRNVGCVANVLIFRPFRTPEERSRKRKWKRKPITEKDDTLVGRSSMHKKKTEEKEAKPPLPKGAFFSFMSDLRKVPELSNVGNCNVTCLASIKWKSMSAEEKAEYCHKRSLKYEDVAGFMSEVVSAHGE